MDRRSAKEKLILESNSLRELLEQRQAELDAFLEDVGHELDAINAHIREVAHSSNPDKDQIMDLLANDAVQELDQKWPFSGDIMHITGKWHVTDFEMSRDTASFPMVRQDAFNTLPSNGFAVYIPEDEPPRVGLSFVYKSVPILTSAIQGSVMLLTYADPSDVSICYVRPQNKEDLKSDTSNLASELVLYDRLLMLHYHDPNSEFYRKSARKQLQFLTEMTDAINTTLPSPYSGYKARCEQAVVPYVYRRVVDGTGNKWQKVQATDNEPILMAGYVQGVGILEAAKLMNDKPITSRGELVEADAGPCLILQVEECSIPDIFNNQPVYLPVRQAEQLELTVP